MLKPIDIQEKEFEIKMRGYDRDQVDDFLDEIMKDMATLYRDNAALTEEIDTLKNKFSELDKKEETIKQTMDLARYQCEEMKKNAQLESKAIIDKARADAESILHGIENNKVKIKAFCEELLEKINRI